MTLLSDPRQATVVLTAGGMWTQQILADPGTTWPTGTTYTRFLDSAGGEIANLAGTVADSAISFSQPPARTDIIPAGAGFETFLVTTDGPYKIRYGRVIRKEVTFPNSPATSNVFTALQFADNFQRSALGSKWVPILGNTSIYDNGPSLPHGVAQNFALLYAASAIRWFSPFNGDTVKSSIGLLNPGFGRTTLVLSADQLFTSFIGCQFDSTVNKIHIVSGTGPTTMQIQAEIPATVSNLDRYTAFYDEITNSTLIYKGDNLTPILTWPDTFGVVAHGPGYRYTGFIFQADLIQTGPQITNWVGQDDVGAGVVGGS